MAQISSINFKKSNHIQTQHNDRDLPPNYLIGGKVECNLNHKEALALKNQIIKDAIEAYNINKSAKAPSFKAKSYEWSAVVNIKPDTTMNDLENLSKHFQEKYGFQCYQIAIHRDEGHINEQGEKIINHHAHMEFVTLDKETGKNNFRREKITPKALRQIQSEVAEILKMERGIDKRKSGVKRIEPRAYAVLKEKEKREKKQEKLLNLLSKTQYQQIIENFRKEQAGKGFTKEFFKDLSELKKNFQEVNETSLSELLNDILEKHREYIEEIKKENIAKIDNTNLNAQNEPLNQKEQKNDTNIDLIKENQFKSDLKPLNELEKENQILKNQIEVMKEVFEPVMRRWKNQAERIKKIDIILPNEKEKTTKEAYEAHIKLEKLSKIGVFTYDNAKIILDKINQFIKTFQNKR